jgi:hypothetical protein
VSHLCNHASECRGVGDQTHTTDLVQPQADQRLTLATVDFSLRPLVAAAPYRAVDLLDLDMTPAMAPTLPANRMSAPNATQMQHGRRKAIFFNGLAGILIRAAAITGSPACAGDDGMK